MAQQYTSSDGVLIIPSAVAKVTVAQQNAGLAVSGVIALVGEAESGPSWDQETEDLEDVIAFGPGSVGAVVAKYKSGPLVDAFRAAVQASDDPNIVGSPSRILCVKTNSGSQASATLNKVGGGTYATALALGRGRIGNQLYMTVDAPASETAPATGAFTWIPNVGTTSATIRSNGGAAVLLAAMAANRTPTQFVSLFNTATTSNPLAAGGADRLTISVLAGTLAVTQLDAAAKTCTVTHSVGWDVTPTVGDTVSISATSVIKGAADANVGAYVVTAATSTVLTLTKLSDAALAGATPGVVTAPVTVGAQAIVSATADLLAFAPVTITMVAAAQINGIGKTMEIAETAVGTDLLSRSTFALSAAASTWVSKTGAAVIIASSVEPTARINLARVSDATDEQITAGGQIGLTLSYLGTTGTVTITETLLTTAITGGAGANLSIQLADFSTIADLAAYINAQTGYSAAAATATTGQNAPTCLDRVTAQGIGSTWNAKNGRIKMDAYKMFTAISEQSSVIQLGSPDAERADLGLPAVNATVVYFSGGKRAGSTNTQISAAFDALANLDCNFVVPLFSQDATDDIAAGLTQGTDSINGETASTYTVDSINASAKSHALAMSKLKRKKNRQAVLSKKGTFTVQKNAASNLASFRSAMTFQDIKTTDSTGTLTQYSPWMGAAIAAGMQTAGFYRSITHKFANVSGVVQADGSFNDRSDDQMEEALLAGLLPMRRHPNGGFYWVSDQTTYTKDSNFVYNSLQAVYAADIIALTTAQRMEDAFVGQSVADISAAVAMTFLKGVMADYMRLKLIAPSDDAPAGFKNALITISGPVMVVSLEIKLSGAVMFIPVNFLVSPVQQTANQ